MSHSYTKAAFCILMSPANATMLSLAVKAIDILDTVSGDKDLKLSSDVLGVHFSEVFPAKGPNAFGSFLDLIDDPAHPSPGCDIDIEEPGTEGLCSVIFSGEQVEIEVIARLIFTACKSALPVCRGGHVSPICVTTPLSVSAHGCSAQLDCNHFGARDRCQFGAFST